MDEEALSSRLSTSEKLLVSQAVYKLGALDWEKISGLLVNHPVIEGRPADWFDTKTCEAYYVGLMTEAGINVYVLLYSPCSACTTFHLGSAPKLALRQQWSTHREWILGCECANGR